MRAALGAGALTLACLVSCSGRGLSIRHDESTATESDAIQGGTTDSTHTFAVGVVQLAQINQNMVAFCTGVLLAPNLVATARHCVAELDSTTIDCSKSTFGALYPASDVVITLDTTIPERPTAADFKTVSTVVVPSGADQTAVCGNDLALLILDKNVTLPEYATPVIDPPMTDSSYRPIVTAIGYGIDTPTDTNGTSAGTRRSKENVDLLCIPGDKTFADCFDDPSAKQILTASEFVSGDSTCEGDSGSGAFEQSSFNQDRWVAFGVLSRGGVSADGSTCIQPIYSRFDAWGSLIVKAAQQAARAADAAGEPYTLPAWAGGGAAISTGPGATTTGATGRTMPSVIAGGSSSGGCTAAAAGPEGEGSGRGSLPFAGSATAALALARRRRHGRR